MDNTTHTLTPNGTDTPTTRYHYLHLFINPSTGSPYLQYTYEGGYHNNRTVSTQRLTLTTSVPSSLILQEPKTTHHDAYHISYAWPRRDNHPSRGLDTAPKDHTDLGNLHAPLDIVYSCVPPVVKYCSAPKYPSTNHAHNTGDYCPQAVPPRMVRI